MFYIRPRHSQILPVVDTAMPHAEIESADSKDLKVSIFISLIVAILVESNCH